MKFGVRECCDVVLRAKSRQVIGNKVFYKNEPVIYFDTLTTSSLEGSANTVYAQGGRGNSRLMSWDGERTVTFTMEDALISPEGFMILSGAGLIEATESAPVFQHVTETITNTSENIPTVTTSKIELYISKKPYAPEDQNDNLIYVMFMKDGEIISEPYIPEHADDFAKDETNNKYKIVIDQHNCYPAGNASDHKYDVTLPARSAFDAVLVDFYVKHTTAAKQIEITPDKFGGSFYLEASTLWRDTNGVDYPAEFVIPNCRIQSNFTFTMASTGDPSTFTFTMDAFPDYTRFDPSKKVLAAIQVIEATDDGSSVDTHRAWSQADKTAPTSVAQEGKTHDTYNTTTKQFTPEAHASAGGGSTGGGD